MGQMLWQFTMATIASPRDGIRAVFGLGLPAQALWLGLALSILMSTIFFGIVTMIRPPDPAPEGTPVLALDIWQFALVQMFVSWLSVYALLFIGRMFDGQGDLQRCLAAVSWHAWISAFLLVVATVLSLALPPIGPFLLMFQVGFVLVAMVIFVAEAHGFQNLFAVAGGIIGSVFVLATISAILLIILGLGPALEGLENV